MQGTGCKSFWPKPGVSTQAESHPQRAFLGKAAGVWSGASSEESLVKTSEQHLSSHLVELIVERY